MDNTVGGSFVDLTFIEALKMHDQMNKYSKDWHTRYFVKASPIMFSGVTVEQCKKEKERLGHGTLEDTYESYYISR